MPRYTGSCHCGAVKFEIDSVIDKVTQCNCSICSKKGILHHRVPPERFRLVAGDDKLVNYKFGTGIASHYFCSSCGIHTFTHPRSAPELFTVNVRTLDDFDLALAAPAVFEFDGRHWEANVAKLG